MSRASGVGWASAGRPLFGRKVLRNGYCAKRIGETTFINVAMLGWSSDPENKPISFESLRTELHHNLNYHNLNNQSLCLLILACLVRAA
jgi:hypothetical protein